MNIAAELDAIHDEQDWRLEGFTRFDDFLKVTFGFGSSYQRTLRASTKFITAHVGEITEVVPLREGTVRAIREAIKDYPPETQMIAMRAAVENAREYRTRLTPELVVKMAEVYESSVHAGAMTEGENGEMTAITATVHRTTQEYIQEKRDIHASKDKWEWVLTSMAHVIGIRGDAIVLIGADLGSKLRDANLLEDHVKVVIYKRKA